jgi:pimeloyl-ACP methyl ester carboxylesterase
VVPGIGLGRESWEPTLVHLGDRVGSCVTTLPGYGVPARPHDDLSPEALADRVLAVLADAKPVDADRVLLVGHSASCQVVARVAAAQPDRVSGLVLVGPTTDPTAATWPRLARRWLATARHEDPRQLRRLVVQYRRTGLRSMARAMDAARRDRIDLTLAGAGPRVLVLRGRHDRICPEDWARRLVGGSPPGSAVVTLDRGGHMVPQTHGRLVADRLASFLADQPEA